MSTDQLLDRLAFQTQALQEGFDILSGVKSLSELAKHFCHILRGSLLTVNVNLFYRSAGDKEWQTLYLSFRESSELSAELPEEESLFIRYPETSDEKVIVILPLPNCLRNCRKKNPFLSGIRRQAMKKLLLFYL
jgi:hypothetical protein